MTRLDPSLGGGFGRLGHVAGAFGGNRFGDRDPLAPAARGFDGDPSHPDTAKEERTFRGRPEGAECLARFGPRRALRTSVRDVEDTTVDPLGEAGGRAL
jgi:hypothetical protein